MWRAVVLKLRALFQVQRAKDGADWRSLAFLLLVLLSVLYVCVRASAKRRESEARLRQRRAQNQRANAQNNAANAASANRSRAVASADPYTRYLSDIRWQNQCVAVSLGTVLSTDESTSSVSLMNPGQSSAILKELSNKHRLYLIHKLEEKSEDEEGGEQQRRVLACLETSGVIGPRMPKHRVLFCTTSKGKSAMIRQLQPTLYIDNESAVLSELQPHLAEVVQVSEETAFGSVHPRVKLTPSLCGYFKHQ